MQEIYSKNWSNFTDSCNENYNMSASHWGSRMYGRDQEKENSNPRTAYGHESHEQYSEQKRTTEGNVKHSNVEVGFSVTYMEFDHLPVFNQSVDILEILESIKMGFESSDWLNVFEAINTLRSLHKSCPHEVNSIFSGFGPHILKAIGSPKPCLNKNILGFIYEVLLQAKESSINISIILKLIDVLVRKLSSVTGWLKSLVENCMNTLLENCLCDQTINAICGLASDRNRTISKVAFHYLGSVVSILKDRISELHSDTLQTLFVCVGRNLESESANNKTLAKDICRYFHFLMKENYQNYIMFLYENGCLRQQTVHKFAQAIDLEPQRRSSVTHSAMGKRSKAPLQNCRNDLKIEINGVMFY